MPDEEHVLPEGLDLAAVFDQQPTAYLAMSPELVIVEANEAYLQLLGRSRQELVGRPVFEAFPPSPDSLDADGDNPLQLSFERARDTGLPDQMPLFHYDVLDHSTGHLEHRVWSLISAPVLDHRGRTQLVLQRVEDVSDYVRERERLAADARGEGAARLSVVEAELFTRAQELRAALAAQDTATQRLAGISRVALQLAGAETLEDLVEIVIGAGLSALGADSGAVGVRDDALGVVRVVMNARLGDEVQEQFGTQALDSRLPAAWAATTGRRLVLPDRRAGLAWSSEMADVYGSTERDAWVALPLTAGDRLIGSLVVGWTEEREFARDELDLLDAFAAQCAQALDRLQTLTAERRAADATRGLSETLQRSLLTEPPSHQYVETAVRYRPASAGAQIGGDWYDAFERVDGDLTLVIGDVAGHDRTAAAVMGQVRNVLRGIAQVVPAPPGRVLTALDSALHTLRVESLVTAVLARVHVESGMGAAGTCTLAWSNAGHPPPLLVAPDGTTTLLERPTDLLLGVDPRALRGDHELTLPAGATVVFYTDGLVERRGEDLDAGTQRLRALVADLADLPVDRLCDALLDAMGGELDDDVALLAIRFRPSSAPRSAC